MAGPISGALIAGLMSWLHRYLLLNCTTDGIAQNTIKKAKEDQEAAEKKAAEEAAKTEADAKAKADTEANAQGDQSKKEEEGDGKKKE